MKKNKLYLFFIGLSLTGYAWMAWNIHENGKSDPFPAICMFKEVTHLPCPSCGTTRSLLLLITGHVWKSIMVNPFGLLLGLAMIIVPVWIIIDIFMNKESFFQQYINFERLLTSKKWFVVPMIAVVLLNWAWNIVKGL